MTSDAESLEALKLYRYIVVKNPRGCVKAWTEAAAASTGNILVQLSDDWMPCYNWDQLIADALPDATKPAVLSVSDSQRNEQGDALLCMAICTRARYEQQRDAIGIRWETVGDGPIKNEELIKGEHYLFAPEYFGVYSDNEFTHRAYRDGVVIDGRKQIIFQHNHPCFEGKAFTEMDATYQRQNSAERYAEGKALFERRNPDAIR